VGLSKVELRQFWTNDHLAVGCLAVEAEIILVIVLCDVEFGRRGDLSHDWIIEVLLRCLLRRFRDVPLSLAVVEYCRSILSAYVGTLSIERCRVVGAPEPID